MTIFYLSGKATLDGITDVQPVNDPQDKFEYTFRIECTRCRNVHDKPVTINTYEKHEIGGLRGEALFVFRCKECKSELSANVAATKTTIAELDQWARLLEIDARGLEVVEFIPEGKFQAVGAELSTKFNEVDLEEGEWYDYDEKQGAEVSITEVEWKVERQ